MTMSLKKLHELTDDEVEARYDATAVNTSEGLNFWRDELGRRREERWIESNSKMARASFRLSIASAIMSALATGIAVATLLVSV